MLESAVIISTSPGRQEYLKHCLNALREQEVQATEVIVVDDGSEGMESILDTFQNAFNLSYFWRPNDGNLSHSRNLGAFNSKAPNLIFINTDILLNPKALGEYILAISDNPNASFWGYVGCRKSVTSPSVWNPQLTINWLDFRFFPINENELYIDPAIFHAPHNLAGGHHFAMSRAVFNHIGPFDESFVLWGEEDVEFALRGLVKGVPMIFSGDVWAEHLTHPYKEEFHLHSLENLRHKTEVICTLEAELQQKKYETQNMVKVLFKEKAFFYHQMKSHYLKHSPEALNEFRL